MEEERATGSRRRPPLAALPNASTSQRRSSLARPGVQSSEDPSRAPDAKRTRRISKRVSFGGAQVKVFEKEVETGLWDDSPPPFAETAAIPAALQPSPMRPGSHHGSQSPTSSPHRPSSLPRSPRSSPARSPRHSPARLPRSSPHPRMSPRRSPRFRSSPMPKRIPSPEMEEREDTLTLPLVREMLENQGEDGTIAPASSPTLSQDQGVLFMDENIPAGVPAPRLSTVGDQVGEDQTLVIPIPKPATALNRASPGQDQLEDDSTGGTGGSRRDSLQSCISDGDVTLQWKGECKGLRGLLDIDEADEVNQAPNLSDTGTHFHAEDQQQNPSEANDFLVDNRSLSPEDVNDVTMTIGDVTSQALPMAALVAKDTAEKDTSPRHAPEIDASPNCASPAYEGRLSFGDITHADRGLQHIIDDDEMDEAQNVALVVEDAPQPISMPNCTPGRMSSTRQSLIVRPALPESRRLFTTDHQPDEDTTIHYHDSPISTAKPQESAVHRQEEGRNVPNQNSHVAQASEIKPKRTTDEKASVASVSQEAPKDKNHNARTSTANPLSENPLSVLSSEAMPREGAAADTTGSQTAFETQAGLRPPPGTLVSEFLQAVNVEFRDDDLRVIQRGASLCPNPQSGTEDASTGDSTEDKRHSTFTEIQRAVQSIAKIKILQAAASRMAEDLKKREVAIQDLISTIERNPPPYFKQASDADKLKPSELSKIQLEFKRLRKASAIRARRDHALLRAERERDVTAAQVAQLAALENDGSVLTQSISLFRREETNLQHCIKENGLEAAVTEAAAEEPDTAVTESLRFEISSQASALNDTENDMATAHANKVAMQSEAIELRQKLKDLQSDADGLKEFAHASTSEQLLKMAEQRRDTHLLLSAVSGIAPIAFSPQELQVRLLDLVDIRFAVDGTAVHDMMATVCHDTLTGSRGISDEFVRRGVEISSAAYLRPLCNVSDIPRALEKSVHFLLNFLEVIENLCGYMELHEAEYYPLHTAPAWQTAEISVKAEYFSVKQHCKFDVVLSVLTSPPENLADAEAVRIRVDAVERIIGKCPSEADVQYVVDSATSRGLVGNRVRRALDSIWTVF